MIALWQILQRLKSSTIPMPKFGVSYYKKQVVILLIVLSVPSLLIGSIIQVFGVTHLRESLINAHNQQITNQVDYINSQMRSLEMNLNYWSHESLFAQDLHLINYQQEYELASEIRSSLFSKQNGNSLIERIHLFVNLERRPAVFNPQYRWVDDEEKLSIYQDYLHHEYAFYWTTRHELDDHGHIFFPLVLVKNIPTYSYDQDVNSASIIVELNHQAVLQMLAGLSLSTEGFSFLVEENSGVVITEEQSDLVFYEEIMASDHSTKILQTINFNDIEYSVKKGTLNRVNSTWTYISAVPVSSITAPIINLSRTIVIASLVVLLISIVVANLTFRSMYRPINKLLQAIKGHGSTQKDELSLIEANWLKLNEEKEALEFHADILNEKLISNLFFQLIEGYLNEESERELRLKLKQYNVIMDDQKIAYVDIATETKKNQNQLLSIIAEVFPLKHFVIPFNDRFFGMIVITENDQELEEEVTKLYEKINNVDQYGQVTVYLSQSVYHVIELPLAVEQIRQRKYKELLGYQSILIKMPKKIETNKEPQVMYPFDTEKKILEAIAQFDHELINQLIDDFIEKIKEDNDGSIQYGFIQLYGAIHTQILKNGMYPLAIYKGKNILKDILQSYDIGRLKYLITDCMIKPYLLKMESKSLSKQDYIVKVVTDYIHENYQEDISLEQCAQELGFTAYTVSKLFKQGKGENFIEYLTRYRIEKAKILLTSSTLKVQEVAEAVGYRHSYFNRIFKKHTNVTPGRYRNNA